jgi:hypothetical protein
MLYVYTLLPPSFMQFCKRDAVEILYTDARSVVQWHSGVFVDPGVLQSHSFIATSFVEKHGIPSTHLEIPLVTRTPGSDLLCQLKCSQVRILLSGVVFLAGLTVLPSQGIDVILGMDWLTKHKGIISCASKTVLLTDRQGKSVSCQA